MSEKEDREYVVEAMGLHAAKLWTRVKPYHIKALCKSIVKFEYLAAEAVAKLASKSKELSDLAKCYADVPKVIELVVAQRDQAMRDHTEAMKAKIGNLSETISEAVAKEAARWREQLDKRGWRYSFNPPAGKNRKYCPECEADDLNDDGCPREIAHKENCSFGAVFSSDHADWLAQHDAEVLRRWREALEDARGHLRYLHEHHGRFAPGGEQSHNTSHVEQSMDEIDALLSPAPAQKEKK